MYVCASPGGHDNFRKMIDEAEPLGYPVVVKNARGHRGKALIPEQLVFIIGPLGGKKKQHIYPNVECSQTLTKC